MNILSKFAIVFVVAQLAFPALAQTQSQCTTTELELMCPDGQILQGINSNGTIICRPAVLCDNAGAGDDFEVTVKGSGVGNADLTITCTNGYVTFIKEEGASRTDGQCSSTHYNCIEGTSTSNSSTSTKWTWVCEGQGVGSTDDTCEEMKPADGQCGGPDLECTVGVMENRNSQWHVCEWDCRGFHGGATAHCSNSKPSGGGCNAIN